MLQPDYRLILKYKIRPDQYESYFRFITHEFVPMMQQIGLPMMWAWSIQIGDQPERQLDFVCESRLTLEQALTGDRFLSAERRLKAFTTIYARKVVAFENRLQF